MENVTAIVTVQTSSGRIFFISRFSGDGEQPEGLDPDGNTVVYYYDPVPEAFAQLYYYDFDTEEFVKGPEPPHPYTSWNPTTKSWDPVEDLYMEEVTANRTRLLYLTDWCFVGDVTLDPADTALVTQYRKELRDFPSTITDFDKPVDEQDWPEIPPFLVSTSSSRAALNAFSL